MLYLCTYIGAGTDNDPYRPVGSDQPEWSAIDLRPDPSVLEGYALVRTPEPFTAAGATPIGELDEIPSVQGSRGIENQLGLDRDTLRSKTLRNIIADLLILWGDEDSQPNGRWKKLLPDRLGHLKAYLGELIFDMAVPAGGAGVIKDSFDRADSATLGTSSEGWSWSDPGGNFRITDNKATQNDVGELNARADIDLDSADHYAQWVFTTATNTSTNRTGPLVRFDAASQSAYWVQFRGVFGASADFLYTKLVDGTKTSLGSVFTASFASGDVGRLSVDGSTLQLHVNGTAAGTSHTDTSLTGHVRTGMRMYAPSSGRILADNFEAGVLAAGPFLRTTGGYLRTGSGILRPA